jgi:hypothetical protein
VFVLPHTPVPCVAPLFNCLIAGLIVWGALAFVPGVGVALRQCMPDERVRREGLLLALAKENQALLLFVAVFGSVVVLSRIASLLQ